jgi:hypothetical protein
LTYSTSVALTSLAAVVPAGSVDRSKRISAVLPPPTLSVAALPKLVPGAVLLTWASAANGRIERQCRQCAQACQQSGGQCVEGLFHGLSPFHAWVNRVRTSRGPGQGPVTELAVAQCAR